MLPRKRALTAASTATFAALAFYPDWAVAPTPESGVKADSIALPLKPARKVSFTTDEGTWVSLDVSPDGSQIVFDLLGDLYLLPIGGGTAKRITSGMQWDCMPRWSPDGKQIAFITDRSGSDNLWVINPDGSGAKAITREIDNTLSSPAWTPDGQYLVVRRFGPYPSGENYLTNVPLWMYHKDLGSGIPLYPRKGGKTTNSGVAFSPDGMHVYFSSHSGGYSSAQTGAFQVMELNRRTGETHTLTSGYGGGLRPITSPDGRWLVYATRHDRVTALRIRDLKTLKEEWLVAEMQRDDQEGYGPNDVLPGYSFTPDSRSVVFTGGGKIKRVDVATKQVSIIPFTAQVEQALASHLFFEQRIDDGPIPVRQLMWVEHLPGGNQVVFGAIGKLWTADLGGGAPRRLTTSALREYAPSVSPDGRWIAYISQSDTGGAQLMKIPVNGGTPTAMTPAGGDYSTVVWSPKGDKLVYVGARVAPRYTRGWTASELAWISAEGGEPRKITSGGANNVTVISTERDGERVYFTEYGPFTGSGFGGMPPMMLSSLKLDGSDKRTHASLTNSWGSLSLNRARPSPDGKWLLYIDRDDAYVASLPEVGDGIAINFPSPSVPATKLTNEGANFVSWGDGGRTIQYSFANEVYRIPLDQALKSKSPDSLRPEKFTISLTAPRSIPQGTVLLRGARIITMKGDEVIPKGDILIENNRIKEVGKSVKAPAGARIIDVTGKTITPGFVDIHAHPSTGEEQPNQYEWNIANHLAFGVTTTRNPSGGRMTFMWNEFLDAGELIGPRLYGTAAPLTTTTVQVNSYADALHVVRRYKKQGANSLKQYLQPRRIARQWIRMAAEAEGINVTNEGAADFKADLTMALDGFTGMEHSLNVVPIYKDVIQLIAQSKMTYTPTLIVAYGGPEGETYWRAKMSDMHSDAKIRRFIPHEEIDRKWRRQEVITDDDFIFPLIAGGVRDIIRAGGNAGLGSHGNQQGLGAQWELRMFEAGGLTPLEVIRVGTIYGAQSIGFGRDLGSIEPGKLADLLVMDANPLETIHNALKLRYVIRNGVIYDANTLDEVWPTARRFPLFPWSEEEEQMERLKRR